CFVGVPVYRGRTKTKEAFVSSYNGLCTLCCHVVLPRPRRICCHIRFTATQKTTKLHRIDLFSVVAMYPLPCTMRQLNSTQPHQVSPWSLSVLDRPIQWPAKSPCAHLPPVSAQTIVSP